MSIYVSLFLNSACPKSVAKAARSVSGFSGYQAFLKIQDELRRMKQDPDCYASILMKAVNEAHREVESERKPGPSRRLHRVHDCCNRAAA